MVEWVGSTVPACSIALLVMGFPHSYAPGAGPGPGYYALVAPDTT